MDFKTVFLLGNASLLGLLLVFFKLLPTGQRKLMILVPPAFLLFQMQHWENAAWATGATSNFIGFLFSGLAIYFLNRPHRGGFGFCILFSILAVLTSGGGLILFAAVAVYLLMAGKYKHALIWIGVFTAVLFVYFHGYVKPQHHPDLWEAILHPVTLFTYLISLLGSVLSADNYYFVPFAPVGGLVGLAYFVYLTRTKYYLKNPAVYCFMLFIILVGCAAALTRSGFGLQQAFSSRYKIFSAGFIILVYLSLIELMAAREEKFKAAFLCYITLFAVAVNILSFPRNTQRMNSFIKLSSINLKHWVMIQEGVPMNGVAVPDEIMTQALKRGIYRFSCEEVQLRRQDREKWCRLQIPPSSP